MIDQLIIGDKASFDDYGASLARKSISPPKKKSIKETVPFSNTTYDFTAIGGEIFWEERELEYVFEMTASSPEKLEEMKTAFSIWVMNVIKEELHDPHIPDYHFLATYEDMSFDDEESMEKTTATVKFSAYPYKIANYPKTYELEMVSGHERIMWIENNSAHKIAPTLSLSTRVWLFIDGQNSAQPREAGTFVDRGLMLTPGIHSIRIQNKGIETGVYQISFREEVF